MTVAELIAKLQEMPQELEAVGYDPDYGWHEIKFVQLVPWASGAQVQLSPHDMTPTIEAISEK